MEWQPIETAPKGGLPVLVAQHDPHYGWDMAVAFWNGKCWFFGSPDMQDALTSEKRFYYEFGSPTHWMPLPEPPK